MITVIGTVYIDIKGFPLGHFVPTGRNAGEVKQFFGGVGRNVAEDVAALGEAVNFVGLTDMSAVGKEVVAHLRSHGVETQYMQATPAGMGTWLAVFDEAGEVCANVSQRPQLFPICDILKRKGREIFAASQSILLEADIDEEIVRMVFELAEEYEKPVYSVISNMVIARERLPYICRSACFVCNRQEAGILFGRDMERITAEELQAVLPAEMKRSGIRSMVVTMDSDGAVFAGADGECGFCPAKRVKVVNTTGAGDAFFAGLATGLTRGQEMVSACELGRAAATAVIGTEENVLKVQ